MVVLNHIILGTWYYRLCYILLIQKFKRLVCRVLPSITKHIARLEPWFLFQRLVFSKCVLLICIVVHWWYGYSKFISHNLSIVLQFIVLICRILSFTSILSNLAFSLMWIESRRFHWFQMYWFWSSDIVCAMMAHNIGCFVVWKALWWGNSCLKLACWCLTWCCLQPETILFSFGAWLVSYRAAFVIDICISIDGWVFHNKLVGNDLRILLRIVIAQGKRLSKRKIWFWINIDCSNA